mmetsp:Transcript_62753/g.166902  ORF Transcript_62753/g.166902 Transcript_62753/m.166902 type:complete len:147 (+) Transcript_62753:97-537(+)
MSIQMFAQTAEYEAPCSATLAARPPPGLVEEIDVAAWGGVGARIFWALEACEDEEFVDFVSWKRAAEPPDAETTSTAGSDCASDADCGGHGASTADTSAADDQSEADADIDVTAWQGVGKLMWTALGSFEDEDDDPLQRRLLQQAP